jgi:rhodanese-related sulfurtransferase
MFQTLFYRMCTVAMAGVVIGSAHSLMVPIRLTPEAPPPLTSGTAAVAGTTVPVAAAGAVTPAGSGAVAAPATVNTLDITLAQARELYQSGVMFADARSLDEYTAGHVEGAVHLPLDAFSGGVRPVALDALDPAQKVVIYCGGGDCHASHDVVIRLNALGYKLCYVMKEGFPAWQGAGYEVAQGGPQ